MGIRWVSDPWTHRLDSSGGVPEGESAPSASDNRPSVVGSVVFHKAHRLVFGSSKKRKWSKKTIIYSTKSEQVATFRHQSVFFRRNIARIYPYCDVEPEPWSLTSQQGRKQCVTSANGRRTNLGNPAHFREGESKMVCPTINNKLKEKPKKIKK